MVSTFWQRKTPFRKIWAYRHRPLIGRMNVSRFTRGALSSRRCRPSCLNCICVILCLSVISPFSGRIPWHSTSFYLPVIVATVLSMYKKSNDTVVGLQMTGRWILKRQSASARCVKWSSVTAAVKWRCNDETVEHTWSVMLTPLSKTLRLGGGIPPTTVHVNPTPTLAVRRNTSRRSWVLFGATPTDRYSELTFSAVTLQTLIDTRITDNMPFNFYPLKCSDIRRLHVKLFNAIQV